MLRSNRKCLMVGAILLGTIAMGASQADACGWWGRCGWCRPACGYSACYTPCYTASWDPCCYTGGWYVGIRPGPIRRCLFGPYRWYYSSWGWSVPCCDTVVIGEPAASPTEAPSRVPTEAPPQVPTEAPPQVPTEAKPSAAEPSGLPATKLPTPGPTAIRTRQDGGLLSIRVPADARVIINGLPTKSTGSRREYVSYGLKPGLRYKYEIRAQVVRGGRLVEDTRTVYLTAGARQEIAFDFQSRPEQEIATVWYGTLW